MEHISYSQFTSYTQCPRNWYLGRVRKAEPKMTWYLPIGTAVHTAVEKLLKNEFYDLDQIFYDLIDQQMSIEPDLSKWLAGGAAADPIVEDKALLQVQDCFANAVEFLQDVEVHEIEYDASGTLPGLDIPIKAYIDILGEHKKHGPVIIDWKTGKQKPKDNFQLETYKALIMQTIDTEPPGQFNTGLWAMLHPDAAKARPVDLSHVSPKDVGAKYQAVYEKMERKLYQTNHGFNCRFCFNQDNCILQAGPTDRAVYYDKASEDGLPF